MPSAARASSVGPNGVSSAAIQDNAVTGAKVADNSLTGADIAEGTLHPTCNVGPSPVLLIGGPCVFRLTTSGSTWQEAIQACQMDQPGVMLPTVAQVEAYARLGGVQWKSMLAWTSDLAGNGPNPGGAWAVQTDANGTVSVIIATPFANTAETDVAYVYDPDTAPIPGS